MDTETAPTAQGPASKLGPSMADSAAKPKEQPAKDPTPAQGPAEAKEKATPEPKVKRTSSPEKETPTEPKAAAADADQSPSFFDPAEIPEELQPHYKRMQAAFTKKTQEIAAQRQKVSAYDQFMSNPVAALQQLATQYGFQVIPPNQAPGTQQQDWTPQTWDEVLQKSEERAVRRVLTELAPMFGNIQKLSATTIERQLDELDPNWREYEDEMRQNIQAHPSLVKDVGKLYRISVPQEVLEAKATQAALKRVEKKQEASKVGTKTGVSRSGPPRPVKLSFSESVEWARQKLNQQGG